MPEFDSDEQRDAYIEALEAEHANLAARKNPRAKEVEAELKRLNPPKPRASTKKAADTDASD